MNITWTPVQRQRLTELNAERELLDLTFSEPGERQEHFHALEHQLAVANKNQLLELQNNSRRPLLCQVETQLVQALTREGFVQVVTPIFLAKEMLDKMTITADHPLVNQVFWIEKNKCLRPMLAPNLYILMRDLKRVWGLPVKIFEVGPCFRKESQGANHLNEFTMLNLVELGVPEGRQKSRLMELATLAMEAAGISGYELEISASEVYGETVDVIANGLELASGAYGPHSLDHNWGIFDPWAGIGFGLERLAAVKRGYQNIKRVGRSLSYLDGSRLNI